MGDCFSISLNITLKNEAAAVRVMQEYIQNKPYVNFGLEENQKRGIGTDNFNDLIRIFFSSCNGTVIDVARNEDIISYNADFDATYSWKSVMLDIFGSIAPFLEDGSELNISSIDDYFCLIVKNGKAELRTLKMITFLIIFVYGSRIIVLAVIHCMMILDLNP